MRIKVEAGQRWLILYDGNISGRMEAACMPA